MNVNSPTHSLVSLHTFASRIASFCSLEGRTRSRIAAFAILAVLVVMAGGLAVVVGSVGAVDTTHVDAQLNGSTDADRTSQFDAVGGPNLPPSPPEDQALVVRYQDEHVVTGSIVDDDDLPPDPAITAGDTEMQLLIDDHEEYDRRVVQTMDGDVVKADGEVINQISDDPDLAVVEWGDHGTLEDTTVLEVNRDEGGVVQTEDGTTLTVDYNGEVRDVKYTEYDTYDLSLESFEVNDPDEGETLTGEFEVSNSEWGHAEDIEVEFRALSSNNVHHSESTTIDVDSQGSAQHTFNYDTVAGDHVLDEVELDIDGGDITESRDIDVDAAGVAITSVETTSPVIEDDELEVTAEVHRYGDEPPGAQSYPISLYIDDVEAETQIVGMSSGQTREITYTYGTDGGDVPDVDVRVASGTDSHRTNVDVVSREEFEDNIRAAITDTNIDDLDSDGTLDVETEFEYDGDLPAGETEFLANFTVDGAFEENRYVSLDDEDAVTETFSYDRSSDEPPITDVTVETPGEDASVTFERDAEIEFTDVTDPAARHEPLDVTVEVTEEGETPGQDNLTIEIENSFAVESDGVEERTIQLEPGESVSEDVTFELTGDAPPQLELQASAADATATRTVEVRDNEPEFEIADAGLEGAEDPESGVDVAATVRNVGGVTGTQEVTLEFDGEPLHSEEVTLDPDEETTVSAAAPAAEEDGVTHSYSASTDDDSTGGTGTTGETSGLPMVPGVPALPGGATFALLFASILGILLVGAGVVKYRNDPAAVRARVRQLQNTVRGAIPLIDSGTVIVQNDLPREVLVRLRVRNGNDVVFLEDFELSESERRTFTCLPDGDQFEVGAGVDDIASHEETFGEQTEKVGVILRPEGITIRELE